MLTEQSEALQALCARHGLLAAVLLSQPEPAVWLGSLNQSDYAHLILLTQTQTFTQTTSRLDAVQLSNQAALVHSQALNDGSLTLLVFPFETRLKDLDQKAEAFLQAINTKQSRQQSPDLLDGLKARQLEPQSSTDYDLLALFSAMPEADPSNDATQPFRISKLEVQTLEKSVDSWKQIF